MGVVERVVVGHAGNARVHLGAAELLGRDDLADRRLHQRRPAEEDGALALDDDRLVGHRRHVGAAGGARAHHAGDLRDAGGGHVGDVEKDAAEVLAVGEHVVLLGQEAAAGVDQVDARQPVLRRDLLRAQVLLHRHRVVGAALDGGVVRHDHAFAARDAADAADHGGRVHVAAVHAPSGELADLEEGRAGIEQLQHALARQQLAAGDMPISGGGIAALRHGLDLSRRSATSARMRSAFALNSAERGLILLLDHPSSSVRPITILWMSLAPS